MKATYVCRVDFFTVLEEAGGGRRGGESSPEEDDVLVVSESESELDSESEEESSEVVFELELDEDEDDSLVSAWRGRLFLPGLCLVALLCAAPSDGLRRFLGASFATSTFRFGGCVRRRKLRPG